MERNTYTLTLGATEHTATLLYAKYTLGIRQHCTYSTLQKSASMQLSWQQRRLLGATIILGLIGKRGCNIFYTNILNIHLGCCCVALISNIFLV